MRNQNTIKRKVSMVGLGLHTGQDVEMTFLPAKEGTGIVFERVDLPGCPQIPATVEYVQDTMRSTTVGIGPVKVHTVEHVLAAMSSFGIDNVCIQVSAAEPPVGDGSSLPFVEMLQTAGVMAQNASIHIVPLQEPVYWSKGDVHLVAIPSEEFRISYTLHYPNCSAIRYQYHTTLVNEEIFAKEIAPCRTFSLYDEVSLLMDRGLIKGGSLENAVVIKDDVIFSKEGLHFPNEMARHKVLDLIGDLSLVGFPFLAHVIAVRSGHAANTALAREIFEAIVGGNRNVYRSEVLHSS